MSQGIIFFKAFPSGTVIVVNTALLQESDDLILSVFGLKNLKVRTTTRVSRLEVP